MKFLVCEVRDKIGNGRTLKGIRNLTIIIAESELGSIKSDPSLWYDGTEVRLDEYIYQKLAAGEVIRREHFKTNRGEYDLRIIPLPDKQYNKKSEKPNQQSATTAYQPEVVIRIVD